MESIAEPAYHLMMYRNEVMCLDEAAMQALGVELIAELSTAFAVHGRSNIVTLSGELGAGKSVLARAMIHAAGYQGRVKSPTYTLVETYDISSPASAIRRIAHLDLYRLADPDELHYIGFDDVLDAHDLVLIEWPDKAGELLPERYMQINIEYTLPEGRRVSFVRTQAESLAQ